MCRFSKKKMKTKQYGENSRNNNNNNNNNNNTKQIQIQIKDNPRSENNHSTAVESSHSQSEQLNKQNSNSEKSPVRSNPRSSNSQNTERRLPAHTNMSKKQLKEFREAFMLFDKDGDGSITKQELGRVMRSLGQFAREEELQQMLHDVDIDGDGCFSFDEFVEIVSNMGKCSANTAEEEEKELRDAFRVFDKHNRGYISASDLRAVLQCLGEDLSEEEIEDMIKEVDVDGDGRIDFYEFVHALGEPGENDDDDDESTN
ncbi:neo-calmodulin-like isoform X2 [Planococcus citri]|uniref:neo-calmodulin-like isoform X2 n=1 Tax=Planococcus citri TaxID=170843 RepID=UPI0031F858D6